MNNISRSIVILCLLPVFSACSISDEDRCSGDFYFEEGHCYPNSPADTDAGPAILDSGVVDGGTSELGMEMPCTDQSECAQYQADYCLLDPFDPNVTGSCAVVDCTTQPNNCPLDYQCCDFPAIADSFYDGRNICLTAAGVQDIVIRLGSCDG
jgi:hypothetical protein